MTTDNQRPSVLVVCLGNICRSPTAEAVLRARAQARGLAVDIDSAGTAGYHQGNPPDTRSQAAGQARGYSFEGIRARQVGPADFGCHDMILAADESNLADLQAQCPPEHQGKLTLFLHWGEHTDGPIPDPYYGGPDGFERVLDLLEQAADGVLDHIEAHLLPRSLRESASRG
ncbi:protein-tyrosine-phosphatase [Salinivibrio kushneri]|uniref:Protein-tyrosine-phosphatase n=1 Tax=Salinivibrio kushneri TaxID=1908198 RepID=A0AB36K144_9GAMM|nr:low molecular weight protein-tyrosine-phosphatase [Salinivibrio kushneri]OOE41192.1 protein-tyrosine-phosphatase [Salinivibrio kushneri]QCP01801.1 low molecular weight phosphotyrosine protein phosphatase [Salinivibrio kushneri]